MITRWVSNRARHLRTGWKLEIGCGNPRARESEHGERGVEHTRVGLWACTQQPVEFLGPYRKLAQQCLAYRGRSCWPNNVCALTYMHAGPHADRSTSVHPCTTLTLFIRLWGVLTFGERPDKSLWRGTKGKQYDKEKKNLLFPLQMPQENVKEIALLEITEKFKTKLSSVTSVAWLSLAHRAPLLLPISCLNASAISYPSGCHFLVLSERMNQNNSPWKAFRYVERE